MPTRYYSRSLEPTLRTAVKEFPSVVLTGPRQSGKTTLLRSLFSDSFGYVSLELPDTIAAAQADPRGFLEMNPPPVILDEVQHVPTLLPYIKERIDADRARSGQYLLTGSQNLLLMSNVTESLAGRAAILTLMPFSNRESFDTPQAALPWETGYEPRLHAECTFAALWSRLLRGSYPELVAHPDRDTRLWQASYIQTYLERDVRGLRQIGDLTTFRSFLRVLAARSGQLLNLADISRDLGLSYNTAKQWLSILETTFQVIVLRPYHVNVGKRLVKTPKVYLTDTGILCNLSGLSDPKHAASGPLNGAIFETAVLGEIVKTIVHRGEQPRVYFWRTANGAEVDIVLEIEDKLLPIEVKSSATPRPGMTSGLKAFKDSYGDRVLPGYVIHTGDVRLPLAPGIQAIPFATL